MKILFIAGEPSGDKQGAYLIKKLFERKKDLKIYAFGGREMERSGAILVENITEKAVVGFTETFENILYFKNLIKRIVNFLKRENIDRVVLVDFPGFNLRLSYYLKKMKKRVYYFIPPQVWAWGRWRIKTLRKNFRAVLSVFPFEQEFLRKYGVNAFYIRNPIIDKVRFCEDKENSIIFLPGSRKKEIERHIKDMVIIRDILYRKFPDFKFYLSLLRGEESFYDIGRKFNIIRESPERYIERAKYAVTVSGTVSLECALAGTPMVVVYKLSEITYFLAKFLAKLSYVSLVNIILNRRVIPEYIQHIKPEQIVNFIVSLESNYEKYIELVNELRRVRNYLSNADYEEPDYIILNY